MCVISLVSSLSSPAATVSKAERLRRSNSRRSRAVGYPRPPFAPYALPVLTHTYPLKIGAGAKEYIHDPNFADPISGGVVEVFRSVVDFHVGLAQIFRFVISLLQQFSAECRQLLIPGHEQ